jgi:hypothetical protein
MSTGERGTPQLPHPKMQAMLLADHAIREIGTNKVTLIGVFDRLGGTSFPLHYAHAIAIYARVTDAEGEYPIRLELTRLDDEQTIGRLDGKATFGSRLQPQELVFNLGPPLTFERPGTYEFNLFADLLYVDGARLNVVQVEA